MTTNTNLRGFLWNDAGDALSAVTVEARVADANGAATTSIFATGSYSGGKWTIDSLDDAYNYEVKLTSGAQVRRLAGAAKPIFYEVTLVDRLKAGDGTVALPSLTFRNDPDTGFYRYGANQIGATVGGALSLLIGNKVLFVGDTVNTGMTQGLTLNQGTNDDEILALKSSTDVDHGMTTNTETDTYFLAKKYANTEGGAILRGFASTSIALNLIGSGVTDITTKATNSGAYVMLTATKKSGTGSGDAGADANLVAILNNGTTRFLFDAEGSAHADVEFVAFDAFDDIKLLDALTLETQRRHDPIKQQFGNWLSEYRELLQRERIVNFYDNGPRAMINFTRLNMLMCGAIRQIARRVETMETKFQLGAGN